MSVDHSHEPASDRPGPRSWLVEALILVGMLGFGYFAIALDDTLWAGDAPVAPADPLTEIVGR
jgi:hypothetical protein